MGQEENAGANAPAGAEESDERTPAMKKGKQKKLDAPVRDEDEDKGGEYEYYEPSVDFETFDQGWNEAIERAAETAKIAVSMAGEEAAKNADAVAKLVLGLKRSKVELHEPEDPFTHSLRAEAAPK